MRYLCKIYEERPEWCKEYPWGEAYEEADYHKEECQFYDTENGKLLSEEELLKQKTAAEIEESCCRCGCCCNYWEDGKPLFPCSALQVVDEEGKVVYETTLKSQEEENGSSAETS